MVMGWKVPTYVMESLASFWESQVSRNPLCGHILLPERVAWEGTTYTICHLFVYPDVFAVPPISHCHFLLSSRTIRYTWRKSVSLTVGSPPRVGTITRYVLPLLQHFIGPLRRK